jgi:aspartyl-tRNA synthetase
LFYWLLVIAIKLEFLMISMYSGWHMQRVMNIETSQKIGEEVVIKGWVNVRRDMGKIIFLDMRDKTGIVQVVLVPAELSDRGKDVMSNLRAEDCLAITGMVNKRGGIQPCRDSAV